MRVYGPPFFPERVPLESTLSMLATVLPRRGLSGGDTVNARHDSLPKGWPFAFDTVRDNDPPGGVPWGRHRLGHRSSRCGGGLRPGSCGGLAQRYLVSEAN